MSDRLACARCSHDRSDHRFGVCRACANQEQAVRYSNAAPAHRFYAPASADDVREANALRAHDDANAYDAWFAGVNEQDARGH